MTTDRLALPTLAAAQAQKEMTHNEALLRLDVAVQPVVVAVAPAAVPASPLPGQCWIVGTGATGAWAGHDGALAAWTGGGWRFVEAFEGLSAWSVADGGIARYLVSGWQVAGRQPAVAEPSGGATVDAQARAVLVALLDVIRRHGLMAA